MTSTAQTAEAAVASAAVPAADPVNKSVELLAWAQRTRTRSQRLRCEASELRETAIEIRDSVHPPGE